MDTTRDIIFRGFKLNGATQGEPLDADGTAVDAATDLITTTTPHGLVAGSRIRITAITGGAPLVAGSTYYVIASGLTTVAFKVATTLNGPAINITTNSTVFSAVEVLYGEPSRDASDGLGKGIAGSVVDDFDPDDVDVVQFAEKRAEADGMDTGTPFLGARRIRLAGTIYGKTRGLCYDVLWQLRAAMSPVLASREIPADKGYLPMYFSVPTNDTDNYPSGAIEMRALVMPKAFRAPINRDQHGGVDGDALAMNWSAVMVMRDPNFEGITPQDVAFADTPVIADGTSSAATNLITRTAHGLVAGDRIYFTRLVTGVGLSLNTTYYVIASGLTANDFKVATTSGGSEVDITTGHTVVDFAKFQTFTGNFLNRGTYNAPLNMLLAVGAQAGTITVTAGGSVFTIAIPATTEPSFTGATISAATNLVTKTAHGLVAGDRIYFTALTGGTGLSLNKDYFVLASGLTANAFKVSATSGGAEVDITVDYSAATYSKVSRRLIRFKRQKVITVEENGVEQLRRSWLTFQNATTWPLIPAGTSGYTITVNGATLDPGSAEGSHMWFWESYA